MHISPADTLASYSGPQAPKPNEHLTHEFVQAPAQHIVIIQSPQARKPLDRMCAHAGDGQTYLVGVDSMS